MAYAMPQFPFYFEIAVYTVAFIVSIQTSVAFGHRYFLKKRAPLNLTAVLASFVTLFYSLYGLVYWLHGIQGYHCVTLQAVNGFCLSSSNALCFMHLYLKAAASNKMNPKWRFWKYVGLLCLLFNWVTLIVVHALITARPTPIPALGGQERCTYEFEPITFKLKWIAQLITHVLMAGLFVWPLLEHMQRMRQNGAGKGGSSMGGVYAALVTRAIAAMAISTAFCIVITVMVLAKTRDPTLAVPGYSLGILDNAITVASIFYAMNISNSAEKEAERGADSPATWKHRTQSSGSVTGTHHSSASYSGAEMSSIQAQV